MIPDHGAADGQDDKTRNPTKCYDGVDIITENDCPFTFHQYCQPCIGIDEKFSDCDLAPCLDETTTPPETLADNEVTEDAVMHYGCCETTALRVSKKLNQLE